MWRAHRKRLKRATQEKLSEIICYTMMITSKGGADYERIEYRNDSAF